MKRQSRKQPRFKSPAIHRPLVVEIDLHFHASLRFEKERHHGLAAFGHDGMGFVIQNDWRCRPGLGFMNLLPLAQRTFRRAEHFVTKITVLRIRDEGPAATG